MTRYTITPPWKAFRVGFHPFIIEVADLVDTRTGRTFIDGAYRVVMADTGKPAVRGKGGTVPFKGETAHMDAERLAGDLYFVERHHVRTV